MPVDQQTSQLFTDLGIGGAALLVVLVSVILISVVISNSVNKLCGKIDELVTNIANQQTKLAEVIISNDKDQKATMERLDRIEANQNEILKKVVRIDDRTYSCLGPHYRKEDDRNGEGQTV